MKLILHIIFLLFFINVIAQDNKEIEIINANSSLKDNNKHPDFWKLIGDVRFKHNNILMWCDSAYYYFETNKIDAFSNIKISDKENLQLTGKKLIYNGYDKEINITGNVILIDKHIKLETNNLNYKLESKTAFYPNRGKIIKDEKTILSKQGTYISDEYKFIFKDSVLIIGKDYQITTNNMNYYSNNEKANFFGPSFIISDDKTMYCEDGWYDTKNDIAQFNKNSQIITEKQQIYSDSLYYNKKNKYGNAISNVQLIDTLNNIVITGEKAEYYEDQDKVEITNKPILKLISKEDTLFMHANRFINHTIKEVKNIIAYNNIKFFRNDLQGKCDSLSYNTKDSIIHMFTNPIIWCNTNQITGDTLNLFSSKGKIKELIINSNPMIITKEDSLDYNQIKGRFMQIKFMNNKIKKVFVDGNGQSIFIARNEKNEKIGVNYIESSSLSLNFMDNDLYEITYNITPESITKPYSKIDESKKYLDGFNWRAPERPQKKEDIFNK